MHQKFGPALLAGSLLAVGFPMVAYAAPSESDLALKLCVVEGGGDLVLSGPTTFDTGYIQAPVTGTDNLTYSASGGYTGGYNVDATQPNCKTVPTSLRSGDYTVYAAGHLDGPCYRTVNGDLVNPPYIVGDTTNATNTPRCPGKVYEIQMTQPGGPNPPVTIRHQDQFTFNHFYSSPTVITFRITDKRLPDCVSDPGPGTGVPAGNPPSLGTTNNGNVCQPSGPTQNPPA